jgi:isoleucyl-tRNA synthetase
VLEDMRREKKIGSSLEAKVVLKAEEEEYGFLESCAAELPALFIVSQVEARKKTSDDGKGLEIDVQNAEGIKCVRCWNYSPTVGRDSCYKELCSRCVNVIKVAPKEVLKNE